MNIQIKCIIKGTLYETETATKLFTLTKECSEDDWGFSKVTLYCGELGRFFMVGEGGINSKYRGGWALWPHFPQFECMDAFYQEKVLDSENYIGVDFGDDPDEISCTIDGEKYEPETATKLYTLTNECSRYYSGFSRVTLFQKDNGALFMLGEGGAGSKYEGGYALWPYYPDTDSFFEDTEFHDIVDEMLKDLFDTRFAYEKWEKKNTNGRMV